MFKLTRRLEPDESLAIEWFISNYMRLNEDKCHLLIGSYKHKTLWANVGRSKILESQSEKPFGIVIERNLNFKDYVLSICNKPVK